MTLHQLNRSVFGAVVLLVCLSGVATQRCAASLIGGFAWASLQPLPGSSEVITQFDSPQIVSDPGVEFTGGLFTPNAAYHPLPIQLINSLAVEVDVLSSGFRITFLHVSGSIMGCESYVGPVLRVHLSGLHPSDGTFISGVFQTSGATGPVASAFVSSPSSVSIDFSAFGCGEAGPLPNTYEFQLQTSVPEPDTYVLFGTGMLGILGWGWTRRRTTTRRWT